MPVVSSAPATESCADGVLEPTPTKPLLAKVVVPMTEVEEANSPCCAQSAVVVAEVFTPKLVSGVKGKVPEPPQALPVFEMMPFAEKVAQPGVPPALETMRFVM